MIYLRIQIECDINICFLRINWKVGKGAYLNEFNEHCAGVE